MLWLLISLFFCWLVFREIRKHQVAPEGHDDPDSSPVDKTYIAIMGCLALAFAWPPFHYWHFERFLTRTANHLAETHHAKVHCNTVFDTLFDTNSLSIGHANIETGEIVIQYPWCATLMDYLSHPAKADQKEIASLDMLTHESMHVRGERDESKTECQAVQRNYRAAKMMGVPDRLARKTALEYYQGSYMLRQSIGGMQAPYFSSECAPGRALDEHLSDSTWGNN